MAWLQNLAGRAEDLLNKIDQNAATVLNESISKTNLETQELDQGIYQTNIQVEPHEDFSNSLLSHNVSFQDSPFKEKLLSSSTTSIDQDGGISFTVPKEESKLMIDEMNEDEAPEKSLKSSRSEGGMSSSSIQNSFVLAEESQLLYVKLSKLEFENQDLQKQLINLKHLYSEMKNENSNLQLQLERVTEQVSEVQIEKEQYKARAQRILQEKEKLISIKSEESETGEDNNVVFKYTEQLKHELENQQSKNEELVQKNVQLNKEIQSLQIQHQVIQNDLQLTIQSLEQSIAKERKFKSIAEDECSQKNNEIHSKTQEIIQLQELVKIRTNEIIQMKEALRQKNTSSGDFESTIKNLTQTLMIKQNNLETVTTERNALKLQLERLESEYNKTLDQLRRPRDKVVRVEEIDDAISVPNVLRISPFDAGVTRRVKHAYSTLDAISIRTGIFLRRYPLARVFVFSYMVILHIWVLMILFWHAPSNQ